MTDTSRFTTWSIPLLLVAAGCGGGDKPPIERADGGPIADAATPADANTDETPDAGPLDGGPTDSGTMDGGSPDSGSPTDDLVGTITYERRPFSRSGLGDGVPAPARGILVTLLDGDTEIAETITDDEGRFRFAEETAGVPDARDGLSVRFLAEVAEPSVQVVDFMANVYAFRTDVSDGAPAMIHLSNDEHGGGMFAIADTLQEGLAYAYDAFERSEPWDTVRVHWEHGRETPGGTSYASGGQLWILGGPSDTDEYDVPVLLHELGHVLQFRHDFVDFVGGNSHAGADTDPRGAWVEGWASFFGSAARNDPFYGDTADGELFNGFDLGNLPERGQFVANPSAPMSQTISEWIIAGAVWDLYQASEDEARQRQRSFRVLTGWMPNRDNDRGHRGRELVDFLDGYLCGDGSEDRDVVEAELVGIRRFPYDFSAPCGKPGRPMRRYLVWPDPVALPGRLVVNARGVSLREVFLR